MLEHKSSTSQLYLYILINDYYSSWNATERVRHCNCEGTNVINTIMMIQSF